MRPLITQHRADALKAILGLASQAGQLVQIIQSRPEDTEGAARDLLIPAEAALAKAQEVVSHLRARLDQKTGG